MKCELPFPSHYFGLSEQLWMQFFGIPVATKVLVGRNENDVMIGEQIQTLFPDCAIDQPSLEMTWRPFGLVSESRSRPGLVGFRQENCPEADSGGKE